MADTTTMSWADEAEQPDNGEDAGDAGAEKLFNDEVDYISSETEVIDGVKIVTEYKKDHKTAERIKVTKKVKVTKQTERLKKAVVDRREWAKFGNALDMRDKKVSDTYFNTYQGIGFGQEGVTYMPEPVTLDMTPKAKAEAKKKPVEAKTGPGSVVVCRICGMTGDHWTLKCPNKEKIASGRMKPLEGAATGAGAASATESQGGGGPEGAAPTKGAYVPPSLRGAGGARRTDIENISYRDDTAALRVSNLSSDTGEDDLRQLFQPFGHISRVYVAKDRITGMSRGFAFVNFIRKEDAAVAMEKLAGYGYDHLILQIEWAKPSV